MGSCFSRLLSDSFESVFVLFRYCYEERFYASFYTQLFVNIVKLLNGLSLTLLGGRCASSMETRANWTLLVTLSGETSVSHFDS